MNRRCYLILLLTLLLSSSAQAQTKNYREAMQYYSQENVPFGSLDSLQGIALPIFRGTTLKGRKINLRKLKGKVVVLNFWFIGCAPCIAEIPGLNQVVDQFKDAPVAFVSIAKETKEQLNQKFLPKHEFEFEIIPDPECVIFNNLLQLKGYPTTIVLDKEGVIQLMTVGGKVVEELASEDIKATLIPVITACLNKN